MLNRVRTLPLATLAILAARSDRPTSGPLRAQSVAIVDSDVYFLEPPGTTARRLTSAGLDKEAALSPDGQMIAFVRRTPGLLVSTALGPEEATELWLMRADGTGAKRLVRGRGSAAPEDTLADLKSPQFSPDGRRVYFLSRGWVTSDAVHFAAIPSGRTQFVCPGNTLEVIPRGERAGYLMVTQHRYCSEGGSYDRLWLVAPNGKTVGADQEAFCVGER